MGGGGGGGGGYFGGGGGGSADIYVRGNPNGYTVIPGAAGGGGGGSSYSTTANAAFDTAPAGQAPSVSITYTPAVTSISSISPATLGAGARAIPITVTGSNFDYPVRVKFSNPGIIAKVNPSTPTALHLTVTVQQGTIADPYTLTVTGADGQVAKCTACLNVAVGPSIQGFVPGIVAPGQKTTFTASGYGFTSDAKLTGPAGVSFSALKVSSDGSTITGTVSVSKTARADTSGIVWVMDGPLGNYGSDAVHTLSVS